MGDLIERLRTQYPEASGRSIKQWLHAGRVRVDDTIVRDGRRSVAPTAAITLGPPLSPVEFPRPLGRIHEDDAIVVIDKPPGLLTIATDRDESRTAYRMLWDYLAAHRPPRRPFIVHRLDRDTSGLVVVAKSLAAKRRLQAQFKARTVERVYVALVRGRVGDDTGTLRGRLAEDRGRRVRQIDPSATRGVGRGNPPAGPVKEAVTHYRVLERRGDLTLLEIVLGTGRRRQIRVQLAALGHPIVGDVAPGNRPGQRSRLHLHATRLGFVHPTSGAWMRFESAPPAMLRRRASAAATPVRPPSGRR